MAYSQVVEAKLSSTQPFTRSDGQPWWMDVRDDEHDSTRVAGFLSVHPLGTSFGPELAVVL